MNHENRWNYSLVAELQKALNESNERVNKLEKMWNELRDIIKTRHKNVINELEETDYTSIFRGDLEGQERELSGLISSIKQLEKENE